MGLTKEVRDFFTGRINRLLDAKLSAIHDKIDQDKVKSQAVARLCKEVGISPAVLTRFEQIGVQRDELYKEQSEIKNLIFAAIEKKFPKANISRYRDDVISEVEHFCLHQYKNKVLEEVYPELVPQIAQINHIKEDVESVVLLSTSETKLVLRLTEVLKKYGGDIQELLDYIPE